ncbi:translocation/assembly module TamB domain-containing protein [Anabaenopsis elenkinii]|uniref:Translocation/assembly module TamB domain-containing protein n=1 Tax=Anabaenopsis elenkinii CCIBt3563 TaxID=2779889 RepID=A0A7S6RBP1_9CYAN|nr:translocation/assembly module TamB domain-containing protein [Anabaenopsis elenkinii]QOV21998.1 translocation/assembly module TamB domain-containing protein [Anabaenopsis elenkinii CCIBt3563]
MSKSPHQNDHSRSSPHPKRHKNHPWRWSWAAAWNRRTITLGGLLLVPMALLTASGVWRLQNFVTKELTPLAATSITNTLNRPVNLGEVTGFSLTGVKFSASSIPPTPTDPDRVVADGVEVGFNPWQLIFQRQLQLDVTLVNPNIYIQQDDQGRWITTEISPPGPAGLIKTDLDKIRLRNGNLVLQPQGGDDQLENHPQKFSIAPVGFSQINGTAQLLDKNQLIKFQLRGQANSGGSVAITGEVIPQTLAYNLQLRSQDLSAPQITNLIKLPFDLQAGKVNSNLQIQLTPDQPQRGIIGALVLNGSADLQGVTMQIPKVVQPFVNTQGIISFQGREIKLDNITSNYSKIPLVATGIIDLDTGFKLTGRVNNVSVSHAQESLNINLNLPVSGQLQADLQVMGELTKPVLSGSVSTIKTAQIDKIDFNKITSKFEFIPHENLVSFRNIQAESLVTGKIKGFGEITLLKTPQLDFNLAAENISGDAIAQLYQTTPKPNEKLFQIGTVTATAQLRGQGDNVQTLVKWQANQATYPATGETVIAPDGSLAFGNVHLKVGGGMVRGSGNFANGRWRGDIQAAGVGLTPFVDENQLQNISLTGATFNGRVLLEGSTEPLQIATIRTENARVNIAGGTIAVSDFQLQNQEFSAQLVTNSVRLAEIFPKSPPGLDGSLAGKFQIAGNTENFALNSLRGNGEGRLSLRGGTVTAANVQLADGLYRAKLQTTNLPWQQLVAVPPQFHGELTGQLNVVGSVDSFSLETIQAQGQGQLNIAGGQIQATNIQLAKGVYQVGLDAAGVELSRLNEQLSGDLAGKFQVSGTLGSTTLADVRGSGQVELSQGIPGIPQPLSAVLTWNGQKLAIQQATATGLNISGDIFTNFQTAGIPEITGVNLQVQAQNYNLEHLPISLPDQLSVVGNVDFQGQITGNLALPKVTGKVGLRDLVIQNVAFEPLLTGNIDSAKDRGLSLDLRGNQDRISLNLDSQNRPEMLLVKREQALVTGQAQGDDLAIKVANFPLDILNFRPWPNLYLGAGKLGGLLTGNLLLDQQTLAARGNLTVVSPQFGQITGDRLGLEFDYSNNEVTVITSELVKGQSRYTMEGNLTQTPQGPQLQGKLQVTQGDIQDVLRIAPILQLPDLQEGTVTATTYGTAGDLTTQNRGLSPTASLLNQLQHLDQVNSELATQQQERLKTSHFPDLADLRGTFEGEISLNTTTPGGLSVEFDLNGENFTWGKKETSRFYSFDNIIAQGNFQNGILQLRPLRISVDNSLLSFTGNIGGDDQSGQLRVRNLPVQLVNNLVDLPIIGVSGNLNGSAALAGSIANPQSKGDLEITEGTLNGVEVESARASFSYADGRFNFNSTVAIVETEPVNITGSIPYQLPFASVVPDDNQISLDVQVRNEGLAILNLLTNQAVFEEGEGEIDIRVRGTLEQPIVNGTAYVNNATFKSDVLPEKVKGVTGKVLFDFDRILVENLEGQFGRGDVVASGEIPIFNNGQPNLENPLTVNIGELVLNLDGLYQGWVRGNLQITGSALNPEIGGQVNLFNGEVLLADAANSSTSNDSNAKAARVSTPKWSSSSGELTYGYPKPAMNLGMRFNNLALELGQNVAIINPPLLSFRATGNLRVNGSVAQPIPDGTIRLEEGRVNLFTTQFNLARGYQHTATFRASQPLDPELDVRLVTKVLDVVQSSDFTRSSTLGLAALESVQVEANVQGFASQLNDVLELTSSPTRSQTEIIALLGGGLLGGQGGRDTTLDLINIAGSAVFSNFQSAFNRIGSAFGLTELRIFPTILSQNPEAGRNNSTLELAAEAGIDISPKVSVSNIKILTAKDPSQWGINYRISEKFRIRASTNLEDDSRAVVEFQMRF